MPPGERGPAASRLSVDRTSAEDAHRGRGARRRAGRRFRRPTLARRQSAWRSQPPTPAVHAPPQRGRVEATGSRVARSPRWRNRRAAARAQVGRQENPLPLNPPRCPRHQSDFPRAVGVACLTRATVKGGRAAHPCTCPGSPLRPISRGRPSCRAPERRSSRKSPAVLAETRRPRNRQAARSSSWSGKGPGVRCHRSSRRSA